MIDISFLSQLDRFNLVIRKRVTSTYSGPRKAYAQGRGLIFKDYRIYSAGDDFRTIDWKVFARTDDLYVKNYEEERNLILHAIVDVSSSMNFGKPISKFEYSSMIGAGFAYLAIKDNDKFMFSTFSDGLDVFQPRKDRSHLIAVIDYLNKVKPHGKSRLSEAISKYRKLIGSRALIVLISDFLIDIEEIKETLMRLAGNEVKVVQVLDRKEKDLALQGDFKLKDSETGSLLRTYISQRARVKYEEMLAEHTNNIEKECLHIGMDFYQVTTDMPIFDAFYKLIV